MSESPGTTSNVTDELLRPVNRRQFIQLASGVVLAGPMNLACGSEANGHSSDTPAPPRDVLFFSDWRAATGNSPEAVADGGKWNIVSRGANESMKIIPASGLDFPSRNVFQMIATARWEGFGIVRKTGLPIPAPGESRYYRWYMRMMQPDDIHDFQTHPVQDGNAASQTNWMFVVHNGATQNHGSSPIPRGQWQPQFWSGGSAGNNARWYGPMLPKNQTFRFELQIERTGADTYRMHVRIYDRANTLIAGDKDIYNINKAASLSSNPALTFNNVANMDGLNAGNNGIAGAAPFPFTYAYEGCFAIRSHDWCGPYTGAF
ncbi:MAG TPA: hypothetical protein VGD27_18295 [Longimicrobiales bacterium]